MRHFVLTVKIEVPDDPFEAADAVAKIKDPWRGLNKVLQESGVKFEVRQEVGQRVAAIVTNGGARRGRPRKQARNTPQPQLPVAEE
jgi:hypothetical protein